MQDVLEVEVNEERLRLAMIAGDTETLADLIDDDLVFTGPAGNVITKQEDLEAHRSQILRVQRLDLFETSIHSLGKIIVTTTKANLEATFNSHAVSGIFAYTRVWRKGDKGWQIQAGHCSKISDL